MRELPSTSSSSDDEYNHEEILKNWLDAVIRLQTYYVAIHAHISRLTKLWEQSKVSISYVGQCPVSQLEAVLVAMQEELEKLRQDIDQSGIPDQARPKKNYTTLVSHTVSLNRLNDQAKTRLHLASLPAS